MGEREREREREADFVSTMPLPLLVYYLETRPVIFVIVIVWQVIGNVDTEQFRSLETPTSCNISNSIPASSQHKQRYALVFHEFDAFAMTSQR